MMKPLRVADIMAESVYCASPDDSLREVRSTMHLRRTRHAVITHEGELVGVVSEADLNLGWAHGPEVMVRQIMQPRVRVVHPDTPAIEAADLMLRNQIGSLPVVDDDGAVVGILTRNDFLQLVRRALMIHTAVADAEAEA